MDNKETLNNLIEACFVIKSILNKEQIDELIDFMNDDICYIKGIVEKNKITGYKQEEDYWFKYIYLEQHTYMKELYYGQIYIPLPNGKYLHCGFEY